MSKQQQAPRVGVEALDGNPLNFCYFISTFQKVVENKIDDLRGMLTRLKYTIGESKTFQPAEQQRSTEASKDEQLKTASTKAIRDTLSSKVISMCVVPVLIKQDDSIEV